MDATTNAVHPSGRRGLVLALFAWGAIVASAQIAIDTRVNTFVTQDGRLLDANPALRGGRFNGMRPAAPLIGGNLFATGNVGRGMSLQSYSPIAAPSAFRAPRGRATLSNFRRHSVSVYDVGSPLGSVPLAQPYYDPATSAYTGNYLDTLGNVGAPSVPGARRVPGLDARVGLVDSQRNLLTPQRVSSPALPQTPSPAPYLSSSLFGPNTATPRLLLPEDSLPGTVPPWRRDSAPDLGTGGLLHESAQSTREAGELRGALATILHGGTAQLRPEQQEPVPAWAGGWREGSYRPGLLVPEPTAAPAAGPTTVVPGEPRYVDPTVMPGYDVFNDMRLAIAYSANPRAQWIQDMERAARGGAEAAPKVPEQTVEDMREHLDQMLNTPIKSLTGQGASALNDMLLKAEAAMQIGHYQEAADRYEAACVLDRSNPLPWSGKGHALLAAGSYNTAADALVRGFTLFPETARFTFDLRGFMGNGEQIDIRRADLLRRLDMRENPQLRFLLGYLEYHTGDRERGLADLRRAAQDDRSGSLIARYPAILTGEGKAPPPRVLPETMPAPQGKTPALPDPAEVPENLVLPPRTP